MFTWHAMLTRHVWLLEWHGIHETYLLTYWCVVATTLTSTLDFSPLPRRKGNFHPVNIACNSHNMDICNFLSRIYPCEPFWKYIQIDTLLGSNHVNFSHILMVNASNQELSFNTWTSVAWIWRFDTLLRLSIWIFFKNL